MIIPGTLSEKLFKGCAEIFRIREPTFSAISPIVFFPDFRRSIALFILIILINSFGARLVCTLILLYSNVRLMAVSLQRLSIENSGFASSLSTIANISFMNVSSRLLIEPFMIPDNPFNKILAYKLSVL